MLTVPANLIDHAVFALMECGSFATDSGGERVEPAIDHKRARFLVLGALTAGLQAHVVPGDTILLHDFLKGRAA